MSFALEIPQSDGTVLALTVEVGQTLFILGANGAGKSGIMHSFYKAHGSNARRVSAHRQTWFSSGTITLSPHQSRETARTINSIDLQPQARWTDDYQSQRTSMALYELIAAENVRARAIAAAVGSGDSNLAKSLADKAGPISTINKLLKLANLPIVISVREDEEIVASKAGSTAYSVAKLSDGERNALLLASDVLTVKPGTLILIDEPERHLHRSIISPLLTLLFTERPDCAFVVSTHEVMLPLDNPSARTVLLSRCTYNGSNKWEANLLPSSDAIPEGVKRDILGARRKLLFVEGTPTSLDTPLYSLVFPDVSVIAKSSCKDVEHAVSGIRDSEELHWVHAFGIVDNDGRTSGEVELLKTKGVYATSVFSVESIYYHPEIQKRIAERHAVVTGENPAARVAAAKAAALRALAQHEQRLSERVVEKTLRQQVFGLAPGRDEIAAGTPINVSIDVAVAVAQERKRFQTAKTSADLSALIGRYPVRETPALNAIADKLGFKDRGQYEGAVRTLLAADEETVTFVRSLFGTLAADIAAV